MSSVVIAGNTSGSITLQAPAVSGSTVLTLPTTSATLITDSSGILNIGSGQLYKDASGNVGIGTSSPTVPLTIASSTGAAGSNSLVMFGSNNTERISIFSSVQPCIIGNGLQGTYTVPVAVGSTNTLIDIQGRGYDGDTYGIGGRINILPEATWTTISHPASLVFSTTASGSTTITERMRIDSSGNVGIGTTAPNNKLTVGAPNGTVGAGTVASFSGANVIASNSSGMVVITPTDSIAANIGGSIGFAANGTLAGYPTGSISGRRENATAGDYSSYMQFTTSGSNGSVQEKMRINSSGYITKPYQPMASVNYTGASTGAFNPILYNNVLLNDGNCYNSSTGRFTCPVAGRYRVQANDMSVFQAATGCYLIVNKNGSAVSGIGYSRADGVAHNHASITAIIQCAVGDYLTLQQATSSFGNGYNHATFEFIG